MKVKGQTVQAGEHYKRTDGQTDGRYQVHYLPRFAVDNEGVVVWIFLIVINQF